MKRTKMISDVKYGFSDLNIPVYNAIKAYIGSNPIPFHMPGHKLGKGIPHELLSEIEKLDLTEIPGTDNLHAPAGVIKEAQELAANAFGAKESFFLVNGSTVGLHAAISSVCKRGQKLIVARDCHKAVVNGMLMAGVIPVYIMPEYSEKFGIYTGITPLTVEKALRDAPDAAGVVITRPNYYGVCSDIEEIARIVHLHNKPLIVDEAHGSHLVFNRRLPVCALEAGADLCIQSAHKTLPAFTQGAYLHVGTDRVDRERVRYYLDMYQTTSPSYIIMAYLDIARELMQKFGKAMLDEILDEIELQNNELVCGEVSPCGSSSAEVCGRESVKADNLWEGICLLTQHDIPGFELDRTRITANVSGLGMTGFMAEKLLRDKFRIQAEMSDLKNIVFISTIADDRETIKYLFSALSDLGRIIPPDGGWLSGKSGEHRTVTSAEAVSMCADAMKLGDFNALALSGQIMEPQAILDAKPVKIPLNQAEGKISKGIISPYPPGIPLVCPGEAFSREIIQYLKTVINAGGIVQGIDEDGMVAIVR